MTYEQMKNYASFLPEQLYIPAGQYVIRDPSLVSPEVAKAQAEFYRVFDDAGIKPDEPSELAWQPAMIIVDALQTLGTSASAEQIRNFIANLDNYPSIDGMLNFQKGPAARPGGRQRGNDLVESKKPGLAGGQQARRRAAALMPRRAVDPTAPPVVSLA